PIGALLLVLANVLLVVRPDDFVGQVRLGRGIQKQATVENRRVSSLLRDARHNTFDLTQHSLAGSLLLLRQLFLQVIHQPGGVPLLSLEELTLFASRLRPHSTPPRTAYPPRS